MATITHVPSQIDGDEDADGNNVGSNGGYIYDDSTGIVLFVGVLKPQTNRPIFVTLTRNSDGATFTVPAADGSMILNVQSEGLMVDPKTGAMLNFGFSSGTLSA